MRGGKRTDHLGLGEGKRADRLGRAGVRGRGRGRTTWGGRLEECERCEGWVSRWGVEILLTFWTGCGRRSVVDRGQNAGQEEITTKGVENAEDDYGESR